MRCPREVPKPLRGFADWLLNPDHWPKRVGKNPKRDYRLRIVIRQIIAAVEKAISLNPRSEFFQERDRWLTIQSALNSEAQSDTFEAPGVSVTGPKANVEFQRMMYAAGLIFEKYPGLAPDPLSVYSFENLAAYYNLRWEGEISDRARKAAYRYSVKGHWTPLQTLVSLFDRYNAQNGRIGWSADEQRMLEEIAGAEPGEPSNFARIRVDKSGLVRRDLLTPYARFTARPKNTARIPRRGSHN